MTQKELLYIEDAIGHEQNMIKILQETEKKLIEEKLINYIQNEIRMHQKLEKKLLKLLEES